MLRYYNNRGPQRFVPAASLLIINLPVKGNDPMNLIYLAPLLVTMAPVVILGLLFVFSSVETSIREGIGR